MLVVCDTVLQATNTISEIIGAGIIPAALEMIDHGIIAPLEEAFHFGFPVDAGAILIIEVDGLEAGLDQQQDRIIEICNRCGAREVRKATTAEERANSFGKHVSKPSVRSVAFRRAFCTQDGVVPRTKLPWIFERIHEVSQKYGIQIVNIFSRWRWESASDFAV